MSFDQFHSIISSWLPTVICVLSLKQLSQNTIHGSLVVAVETPTAATTPTNTYSSYNTYKHLLQQLQHLRTPTAAITPTKTYKHLQQLQTWLQSLHFRILILTSFLKYRLIKLSNIQFISSLFYRLCCKKWVKFHIMTLHSKIRN